MKNRIEVKTNREKNEAKSAFLNKSAKTGGSWRSMHSSNKGNIKKGECKCGEI